MVRKKIFCTGLTWAAQAERKSLVPARQAQRTNQERTLSFFICPLRFTFTSVSQLAGSTPLLVSLRVTVLGPHVTLLWEKIPVSPCLWSSENWRQIYRRVQGRTFQSDNWNDFLTQKIFARGDVGRGPKIQGPQPERWFYYGGVVTTNFVTRYLGQTNKQ